MPRILLPLCRLLFLSLALVVALGSSIPAQQPGDIFLKSTRWLDPSSDTATVGRPVVIQISNGRIARITPAAEFTARPGASVTDLGTATILPGLIDAHVHLQIGGGQPQDHAAAILRAGFTTVADLGSTSDDVLRLRDRIASGAIQGPTVLGAGKWVGTKDGICEFGGIGVAGGPDAFRARVRENVAAGADLIKVCVSAWVQAAHQQPNVFEIAEPSLAATVDESRKSNKLVIAHAISLGGANASLRFGVNGLAHAAYVDEATARAMRDRGMFMVPTLASLTGERTGPAAVALRQAVALAHREGVTLVFGTDGGVLPHGQNAQEFKAMLAAGVPAIAAIRAATVNAARALRLPANTGRIVTGAPADLIAVDGDPLADVQALSRVVFVMRVGKISRRAGS